jgi:molybdenum cofactor biosynthesis enzyme MoaA
MPCFLLHIIEQPDPVAYDDADLKDVVGQFPRCFCSQCNPPRQLKPGEVVKCLDRTGPCWKPVDKICP